MTVGNLYRYFNSKDAILAAVVAPVVDEINDIVAVLTNNGVVIMDDDIIFDADYQQLKVMIDQLSDKLVDIYIKHKVEFNILMMNSTLNEKIVDWFTKLIIKVTMSFNNELSYDELQLVFRSYAVAIVSGFKEMYLHSKVDDKTLKDFTKVYLNSYIDMIQLSWNKQEK